MYPWEALGGLKLTGRQTLASFLSCAHSDGEFMIENTICANGVAYGLFEQYIYLTENV